MQEFQGAREKGEFVVAEKKRRLSSTEAPAPATEAQASLLRMLHLSTLFLSQDCDSFCPTNVAKTLQLNQDRKLTFSQ